MRATDFFLYHYQTTPENFIEQLKLNFSFIIPSYLCAHPRPSFLHHIKECIFLDFVRPIPDNTTLLICICIPSIIIPSIPAGSSTDTFDYFDQIERSWSEYLYIRLEDLEICPINPRNTCQYLRETTLENHH